ncbi:MAG: isocitrate lyase/phosphoenolpyruvate mutase family protein [Myxococcota bacterium]|nr:isocitrate lyase/phosphoenolpyruvate mutase family protein [Myxococcota bacterium]
MSAMSTFRAMHEAGCFVIPNPWDIGSAIFLQHAGFRALATTSAGFAFSRGLPDEVLAIPSDMMLAHIAEIVGATSLPVNADFQSGFAHDLDELARNITACCATGVAGLSIEDATGDRAMPPLYPRDVAIQRIRAARRAIDAHAAATSTPPVVLTARCEAYLAGDSDPAATSLDRLVAYADAGADCLFAPAVRDPQTIAAFVRAVAPKPLNVIVSSSGPGLTVAALADIGVRRISVGSALARVAWSGFMKAARGIAETGTFDALDGAAPFAVFADLFRR